MSKKGKIIIAVVGVVIIGGIVSANVLIKRDPSSVVKTEKIEARDIQAVVSASGNIRAKTEVEISANTTGPIKQIAVAERQMVKKGDLLCEIDPKEILTALTKAKTAVEEAETRLRIAEEKRDRSKQELERLQGLATTSAKDVDAAKSDVAIKKDEAHAATLGLKSSKADLERANHELTKVRIESPLDGCVTSVLKEVGETVVGGQMSGGAGTVIMVICDISEMQVELEVDETDIIHVEKDQPARIEIDAYHDKEFKGVVTRVGASPRRGPSGAAEGGVTFDVVITLLEKPEGMPVGLSATAEIVTSEKKGAVAVPIQAVVGREYAVDEDEQLVRAEKNSDEMKRKEFEGVYLIVDGKAQFRPVELGIYGEKYFEVLAGLEPGEEVVTGPNNILRDIKDDDPLSSEKK